MSRLKALRDALFVPGVSSLAAAAALGYALFVTRLDAEPKPPAVTPERAAQEFAHAYRSRDYAEAARLSTGQLRRELENRIRSARLRGARATAEPTARVFVIDESFMLEKNKLKLGGVLADEDTPDAKGWPVSITVVRDGDTYFAEALNWPKGPPPDDR